jgi:hypothetical protein
MADLDAMKPDFRRTYQIEQGLDVVRSVPAGIDRVSMFSFKAVGPKLAPLFDGLEQRRESQRSCLCAAPLKVRRPFRHRNESSCLVPATPG